MRIGKSWIACVGFDDDKIIVYLKRDPGAIERRKLPDEIDGIAVETRKSGAFYP